MNTNTMAHANDPSTSHEAASQVDPHASRALKLALIELLAESPRTGDELTAVYFRLAEINGWPRLGDAHSVKRRLSDLHTRHKVIRETGDRRPSAHDRPATVWELSMRSDVARAVVSAG